MIYKINDNTVIDAHGYRTLKNGKPTNQDKQIIEEIDESEIESAMLYVSQLNKIKKTNKKISSYGLKHRAEEYLRYIVEREESNYISNGALIVALLNFGFIYKTDEAYLKQMGFESINIYFNVSQQSINRLKR